MVDKISKEKRSRNMAKIRNKDTSIELTVRKWLFAKGLRYRVNENKLPGCPDIVLKKYKAIVFVNGCFWHGHTECDIAHVPKSREDYWLPKINRTIQRDKENISKLKSLGWRVYIIWECELKNNPNRTLNSLLNYIFNDNKVKNA